jgi:hypothetical protein
MAGITLFPGAIDDDTTLPDVGPTDQENVGIGPSGLFHDELLSNAHAAIKATQTTLIGLALQLNSKQAISQSQIAKLTADILALQSNPAFDETRLLSRDARMDAMASQIAILLSAPAPSGGSTDPLTIHLTAEVFGS